MLTVTSKYLKPPCCTVLSAEASFRLDASLSPSLQPNFLILWRPKEKKGLSLSPGWACFQRPGQRAKPTAASCVMSDTRLLSCFPLGCFYLGCKAIILASSQFLSDYQRTSELTQALREKSGGKVQELPTGSLNVTEGCFSCWCASCLLWFPDLTWELWGARSYGGLCFWVHRPLRIP